MPTRAYPLESKYLRTEGEVLFLATPQKPHNLSLPHLSMESEQMIRKLKSGEYRLYSRKKNPKTGKRRNLGTFSTREQAQAHERAVQFFKRH
jgi:hypothetical protein